MTNYFCLILPGAISQLNTWMNIFQEAAANKQADRLVCVGIPYVRLHVVCHSLYIRPRYLTNNTLVLTYSLTELVTAG